MKAVLIHKHGGPEALSYEEIPDPSCQNPQDILIQMKAMSINHLDLWVREGIPG